MKLELCAPTSLSFGGPTLYAFIVWWNTPVVHWCMTAPVAEILHDLRLSYKVRLPQCCLCHFFTSKYTMFYISVKYTV